MMYYPRPLPRVGSAPLENPVVEAFKDTYPLRVTKSDFTNMRQRTRRLNGIKGAATRLAGRWLKRKEAS